MELINQYGFLKVKAVSPKLELANVSANIKKHLVELQKADKESVSIVVFPELSLCGYTCEDLFHQQYLLENCQKGLIQLVKESSQISAIFAIGIPYQMPDGRLYNSAVVICRGKILGMVFKKYLPNYSEFYDARFFASGIDRHYDLELAGQKFYAGDQIFQVKNESNKIIASFGIEICEDLFATNPPSTDLALAGAEIILNLSASNELVGKANYRKELISQQSARLHCGYIYASAGPGESTKDTLFGGHCLIYENGNQLAESERFSLFEAQSVRSDIDVEKIRKERRTNTTFAMGRTTKVFKHVEISHQPCSKQLDRKFLKNPFVPNNQEKIDERAEEILEILATGLARILQGSKMEHLLLGLSGGMDSTLVALISKRALTKLGLPIKNLHTISMPGFGTSDRTKNQAQELAQKLGTSFKEISIVPAMKQHFKDIEQPKNVYDNTYENAQARERTQILLDLANQLNGIMVSGSSLSELAVGYATYGGDSISHINILGSCPKSLSKWLIAYEAKKNPSLSLVLNQVLATKISAELLPTLNKQDISQSSEEAVGNYEIIDFCIYHQLRNGYSKKKINYLLKQVYRFDKTFSEHYLFHVVETYFKRFYQNQFKRTMMPQTIKLGVSLSPRSDWRMPDLTSYEESE